MCKLVVLLFFLSNGGGAALVSSAHVNKNISNSVGNLFLLEFIKL